MFKYQRRYCGPIRGLIMDLAGTCVDYGSLAPIQAFQTLFEAEGIVITPEEAREPMGKEKREHIIALLNMPRIQALWQSMHSHLPSEIEVDRLYNAFVAIQQKAIQSNSALIPGMPSLLAYCKQHEIAWGVNTGYSKAMVRDLISAMAEKEAVPQSVVCADDVPQGRPYPWMALQNARELGVPCVQSCIQVDDTPVGIKAGLNAGMWTVGVAISGNCTGLSETQWESLNPQMQAQTRQNAYEKLYEAGAHYVIDSIATLPAIMDEITQRLQDGESP